MISRSVSRARRSRLMMHAPLHHLRSLGPFRTALVRQDTAAAGSCLYQVQQLVPSKVPKVQLSIPSPIIEDTIHTCISMAARGCWKHARKRYFPMDDAGRLSELSLSAWDLDHGGKLLSGQDAKPHDSTAGSLFQSGHAMSKRDPSHETVSKRRI